MLGAPREVREWKMWPPSIKTGKRSIARWTFSPDFEDILKQCEASVERLTKQVALLSSLDNSALRMASLTSSTLPPSEIEAIEIAVERVLNLALPTDGADQDLQAVNNEVAQIANRVNQLEQYATAFRPQVQVRLNEVAAFFANLQPLAAGAAAGANTGTGGQQPAGGSAPFLVAAASHVRTDLPAPFLALSQFTNNEIPEAASFTALADLDADVYKLSLIQRYAQLNPNLNATNPAPLTKEALYPEVLKHLKLRSWDAIRTARGLLLQAEQGLYRDDVEEALKGGKERAFVGRDRLDIRPNTSVGLDLRFRREALNQASARDEFRCLWEFEHPDGTKYTLPDPCWNLSRYFPLAGLYKIRVLFEDWKGHPVVDDQGQPVVVSDQIYVTEAVPQRAGPRLRLELVGMFLALSPAVFALLTTAQEQVAQLEWYSGVGVVLALGFGIDTLKTLLAQKGTP
jgi:hypothetical protein